MPYLLPMGIIRFILAISVVIAHTSPLWGLSFVGGEIAVKLFFMISGFYMALILNEKYIGKNGHYSLFIKNRILRLYPVYLVILIITLIVQIIGLKIDNSVNSALIMYMNYSEPFSPITWLYLVFSNLFMIGIDLSLFLGIDLNNGSLFFTPNFNLLSVKTHQFLFIPQSWSISIEMFFYFVAPFICRSIKAITIVLLISLSVYISIYYFNMSNDPWNYRFLPSQFWYFMLGSLGYFLYTKKIANNDFDLLSKILLFVAVLFTIFFDILTTYFNESILQILITCLYAIAIPFIFKLTKNWKIDRFIGELSYPIYMVHMLCIYMITLTGITRIFIFGKNELVLGLTLVVSIALYKLFIKKIEQLRIVK